MRIRQGRVGGRGRESWGGEGYKDQCVSSKCVGSARAKASFNPTPYLGACAALEYTIPGLQGFLRDPIRTFRGANHFVSYTRPFLGACVALGYTMPGL